MINLYNAYEINLWALNLDNKFTLGNSLFGSFRLTKNPDPDKHSYFGYDIGFDVCGFFHCQVLMDVSKT